MDKTGHSIHIPIDEGELSETFRKVMRVHPLYNSQISFCFKLSDFHIRAIPEHIKDKVLEWALALEKAGVKGEGMSFSARDKEIAHNVTFSFNYCTIEQVNNRGTNQRGGK